jgi:hypothetical protein
MEKHEETLCEANSKDYSMSFKLQIVQEIEKDNLQLRNPQRLMAFKIEQLLLNGSENSVTLIGKTKHHLLCQSQNKDHGA